MKKIFNCDNLIKYTNIKAIKTIALFWCYFAFVVFIVFKYFIIKR